VNLAEKVKDLGVGKRQLIEIAKALSKDVKLLILDEPTAALNEDDSENLLNLLRDLKTHGVTCVLISHKLKEVIKIADTVTVLRDGQTICTLDARKGEVSENVLIKHMVGREINNIYPKRETRQIGEVVLNVENWNAYDPNLGRSILKDVSFHVNKGEIVGLAGLMGSGRTELALSIFGNPAGYHINGEISMLGSKKRFRHPEDAISAGVAYVTVNDNAEVKIANEYKISLNIKTPNVEQIVSNLSGGNQQKVSVGKWLFVKPNLLILDEPTRGIDVGAKYEIYTIMTKLVEQGMSIIMISSELSEILGMSDRIYVVSAGKIAGELAILDATQEKIMQLATNY
jgi:putative multiple sugar transport system ATP-binding protein